MLAVSLLFGVDRRLGFWSRRRSHVCQIQSMQIRSRTGCLIFTKELQRLFATTIAGLAVSVIAPATD